MQVMQLMELLLLGAALTAAAAGSAAAQDGIFDLVPANPSCSATPVGVPAARGEIECAMRCQENSTRLSFSFINGSCVLSDSASCAASGADKVFAKRVQIAAPLINGRGYEQQIGDRRFWVFQQRQSGLVNFARNWTEYERGFGDASNTEFWSGLSMISNLTKTSRTLRIEMTTFNFSFYVSEWLNFTVADASTSYTMTCGAYLNSSSNTSGDALTCHRGMKFSTIDADNDLLVGSCPNKFGQGGFWYKDCYQINPNGLYPNTLLSGPPAYNYTCCDFVENDITLRGIRMMLQI